MKSQILSLSLLATLSFSTLFAQDRTTVTATNSEISDNLDLRAVASIFGDSENLEDFERRLNDPKSQISNLDLNEDNQVDYMRVIETIEGNTHIIVIQSVLGRDTFQDVASIEVEKDRNNRIQVQVVGDVYMYGQNYIYEPVYSYTPVIYSSFWVNNYRPYCSTWYWGYYPSYYVAWNPFPIFRYRNHISFHINSYHHYNYVNIRRCQTAYNVYYNGGRRGIAYQNQHPNRSFTSRNTSYTNRYELDQKRNIRTVSPRNEVATANGRINSRPESVRNTTTGRVNSVRTDNARNESTRNISQRDVTIENTPSRTNTRSNTVKNETTRGESPRTVSQRNETVQNTPSRNNTRSNPVKSETPRTVSQRNVTTESAPTRSNTRSESTRSSENQRASSRNISENKSSERAQSSSRGNKRS
ncbi:MAG TPA: hypothetical protein PLH25_04600 [Flavobacterium sp.]|nr:hypothetical protein [Flavobacterium sp.]